MSSELLIIALTPALLEDWMNFSSSSTLVVYYYHGMRFLAITTSNMYSLVFYQQANDLPSLSSSLLTSSSINQGDIRNAKRVDNVASQVSFHFP